jgi:hypothetical protein
MKLTFLVVSMVAALVPPMSAQTNTFPSSGSVGIGTTTPNTNLQIHTASGDVKVAVTAAGYGNTATLQLGDGVNNNFYQITTAGTGSSANDKLVFNRGGTEMARFNSSGYLGLGASNPQARVSFPDVSNDADGITWYSGAPLIYGIYKTAGSFSAPNYQQLKISFDTGVIIDGGSHYGRSGLVLQANGGNVGIGTTNPTEGQLQIEGNSDAGSGPSRPRIAIKNNAGGGSQWIIQSWDTSGDGNLSIQRNSGSGSLTIPSGNVGIGTTNPTEKLSVNGKIQAKEVIVQTGWSDYVFDESYKLKALSEVEAYVKAEKHLPGIPSAQEVAEHGVSMGEMQSKLLAQVEELTLHLIAQEKQLKQQQEQLRTLARQNEELLSRLKP